MRGRKQIIPDPDDLRRYRRPRARRVKRRRLGNQFLANIRECDAIAHVLRCFEDGDITHVEGRIDPVADAETIETELMLADLESHRAPPSANLARKLRGGSDQGRRRSGPPIARGR